MADHATFAFWDGIVRLCWLLVLFGRFCGWCLFGVLGGPLLVTLSGMGFCFCEAYASFADFCTSLWYLSAVNEYFAC